MLHNDFAIILQGGISFNTEKIIEYYHRTYDCHLILSTHTGQINFDPGKYSKLQVVESDKPKNVGIGNRNIQRVSSYHGIKLAKDRGIKYSLKSRTDHFFKHPQLIELFKGYFNTTPLFNTTGQNERIIVPNGGTTMNYLCGGETKRGGAFHISDHWLCGNTEDLFRYFDINNPFWAVDKPSNFSTQQHPITATEVEFCRLWMKANNITYPCVSEILRDKFVVLDNQELNYDQVKGAADNIMDIRTDWVVWCDPLSMHHNIWLKFYNGQTYSFEQEIELNKHQRFIF
jgi:WavE lipopolysaccharide synthesis protein